MRKLIDTIEVQIPIKKSDQPKFEKGLDSYLVLENGTGEVKSQFTRGSLKGSWDSRISVSICDRKWESFEIEQEACKIRHRLKYINKRKTTTFKHKVKVPMMVECDPYLKINFSLPKATLGVNFVNTSIAQDAINLNVFRKNLQKHFAVNIPPASSWAVTRADIANVLFIGSEKRIVQYFLDIKMLEYPRRKTHNYKTGIYFPGQISTFKIYGKHEEFKKHDLKKFKGICRHTASKISKMTKGLLRCELELRKKGLIKYDIETIGDLFKLDLQELLKKEMLRILNTTEAGVVMKRDNVIKILKNAEIEGSKVTFESAISVWDSIILHGKDHAKKVHGRNKYYRSMTIFKSLNIPLVGNIYENKVKAKIYNLDEYRKVGDAFTEEYYKVVGFI